MALIPARGNEGWFWDTANPGYMVYPSGEGGTDNEENWWPGPGEPPAMAEYEAETGRSGGGGGSPGTSGTTRTGTPRTSLNPLTGLDEQEVVNPAMAKVLADSKQAQAQLEFDITKEAAKQAYDAAMAAQAARIVNQTDAQRADTTNATLGQRQSEAQGGLTLDAAKTNATLAAQAAAQHVQMVFNSESENAKNRLAVLGLVASLKGPRNAFVQQAVVNGLNKAGLSKAIDAAAGRIQLPGVQADQAIPQPMTLESFLEDNGLALPGEIKAPAQYDTQQITAPTLAPFTPVETHPIDMPSIPGFQPPTNDGVGGGVPGAPTAPSAPGTPAAPGAPAGGLSVADAISQARQQLGALDKSWLTRSDADIVAKIQSDPSVFTGNNPIRRALADISRTGLSTTPVVASTTPKAAATPTVQPTRVAPLEPATKVPATTVGGPTEVVAGPFNQDSADYLKELRGERDSYQEPDVAGWQATYDANIAAQQAGKETLLEHFNGEIPVGLTVDPRGNIVPTSPEQYEQMRSTLEQAYSPEQLAEGLSPTYNTLNNPAFDPKGLQEIYNVPSLMEDLTREPDAEPSVDYGDVGSGYSEGGYTFTGGDAGDTGNWTNDETGQTEAEEAASSDDDGGDDGGGDDGGGGDSGGDDGDVDDDDEGYKRGTFRVLKTGKRRVHKGEMVMPKEVAEVLRSLPGIPKKGPMIPKKPTLKSLVAVK